MKNKRKRILAFVITVVMAFSLMPGNYLLSSAAEVETPVEEGAGDSENQNQYTVYYWEYGMSPLVQAYMGLDDNNNEVWEDLFSGDTRTFSQDGSTYNPIQLKLTAPELEGETSSIKVMVNGEEKGSLSTETGANIWTYTPETSDPLSIDILWTVSEYEFWNFAPTDTQFVVNANAIGNGAVATDASEQTSLNSMIKVRCGTDTDTISFTLTPDEGKELISITVDGTRNEVNELLVENGPLTYDDTSNTYTYTLDTSTYEAGYAYNVDFEFSQEEEPSNDYNFCVYYDNAFGANVSCVLKETDTQDVSFDVVCETPYSFQSDSADGYKTIELTLTKPSEYYSNADYTESDKVSIMVNGVDKTNLLNTGTLTWTYTPESPEALEINVYWTDDEKQFGSLNCGSGQFMVFYNEVYNGSVELVTTPTSRVDRKVWYATRAVYSVETASVTFKLIPNEGEDVDKIRIYGYDDAKGEEVEEFISKDALTKNDDGSYTYVLDTSGITEYTWKNLEFVFTNKVDGWLYDYDFRVNYDGGYDANVFCELKEQGGAYVSCGQDISGSFRSDSGDGYKTIRLTLTKPGDYYGDGADKEQDKICITVNGEDKTSLLNTDMMWEYTPSSPEALDICVYWTEEDKAFLTLNPDPEQADFMVECWVQNCGQVELETQPTESIYRKGWNTTKALYPVETTESITFKLIPDDGQEIVSAMLGEVDIKDALTKNEDGTYTYTWDTSTCGDEEWYTLSVEFSGGEPFVEVVINETPQKLTTLDSTTQLTAKVLSDGEEVSDQSIVWSSSDSSIATVENGEVKAVANGIATITATLKDNEEVAATVSIEVAAAVETATAETAQETGSNPGTVSAETNIATEVKNSIAITEFNTATTKAEMDTKEQNLVKNHGEDAKLALYVTPLTSVPEAEKTAIENVKATLPVETDSVKEIMTLDISMFKTVAGDSERVTELTKPIQAEITVPEDARLNKTGVTRHYFVITRHEGKTTISDNLVFNASSFKITLTLDKFSTRVLGYYDTVDVTGVTVTGDTAVLTRIGAYTQLSAGVTPDTASIKDVTWTSSNPAVATVDATGKVTAVANGTTTITATSNDKDKTVSGQVAIKVSVPAASVEISRTEATLNEAGATVQLTASVLPAEAENREVTWMSDNPAVATVDAAGKVTAVANGTTTITVTSKANAALKKECKVTVDIKAEETPDVTVSYHTHIQTLGDSQGTKTNGQMAGTTGMAKRLENIRIQVSGNQNLGIQYSTHCQTYGWLPWSSDGEINGTSGEAKRLEAVRIQLTGADKDKYDVYYRVHAQSYGWLAWVKNGEPAGTAGYAKRLEGIQIVVVKKGTQAPGLDYADVKASATVHNNSGYISKTTGAIVIPGSASAPNVMYKTHVQTYGWQTWRANGVMSGTSGEAKRLEGINIRLSNCDYAGGIRYMTHIQTYGWSQGWKTDGAMAGTSGEAKRLEAIRIELTGEMAEHYDVYYRVHAQSYGWMAWAKNGESAGTAGYAKRLEGIQIILVPKGGAAPSATYGGITSTQTKAFIQK